MKEKSGFEIRICDDGEIFTLQARKGELLLDVLRRNSILVQASCGGKGTCGKCKVYLPDGKDELACRYPVHEDVMITLPDMNDYVILDQLNPHARVLPNRSGIAIDKSGSERAVSYKGKLIAKTEHDGVYGVALDVGTTTLVIYLVDFASYEIVEKVSVLNPQANYGADVISRIEYCIRVQEGLNTLKQKLISQVSRSISQMCRKAGISPNWIYLMTVVGNTVMLHLLMGVNPSSIAFAPYTPVFTEAKTVTGTGLNFGIHPAGIVHVLPSLAGYVGADIIAGLASTDIMDKENFILYIDIGTNGEIVLGNREVVYACATAAGPAFEGARIQCGVGGVQGAISAYTPDGYETIGNKKPVGICGSGLIDIVAFFLDKGLIDFTGMMKDDILIEEKKNTAVHHDIVITQKDIREVQLAKSAIYAGIKTLAKEAGIGFSQIESVYLAGGFGNYIRPENAVRLGLLPDELSGKIIPIGNSAGTGALLALKSLDFENETERILAKAEYIELSLRPDFNEEYVQAMFFPEPK